ncbi:MAG: hypothetical protein Q8M88_08840 [Phenylobacterium sp.]|uniref:hypothetical protein n=1 Tax=Phenylobacterium sp. TaxID=1871053 RepID=UPI002737375A|nr:hypothetical protein [Phenylobacterium sp.]MDP3174524.1 hypothetical protein [Phenylobacterium sp.]
MQILSLPPSVTLGPTIVGVSVLTPDGATVQVDLPRPKGLHDMPEHEIEARARTLAKAALMSAAQSL